MDAKKEDLHQLLVQADAIVKLCYFGADSIPEDPDKDVASCALLGVSRLLNQSMGMLEKLP